MGPPVSPIPGTRLLSPTVDGLPVAGLEPGQAFEIAMTQEGLVLRPVAPAGIPEGIDPDQAWFWTPEWQAKEREAEESIAAGRVTTYYSLEEFLAALGEE